MMADLYDGFATEDFQKKLAELDAQYTKGSARHAGQRQKLFLEVQKLVLPKYGFDGNFKGVMDMMSAVQQFNSDEEFAYKSYLVNELVGLVPETPPTSAEAQQDAERKKQEAGPDKPKAEPEYIFVTVKHAVQRDEIQVSVLSTATFKRVKEALSAKLGRSDIMAARFVFKQAGTYVSYKDGDAIGDRRKINILGVEDLKPAPGMKPQITLEEALQMQRDLAEGFGKSEFQQKLSELESKYGQSRQFLRERQMLFLTVQKVVLPKYGFDGNPKGVYDMMQAFNAFSDNQEFNMQG